MITAPQLSAALDCPLPRAENWAQPINDALQVFGIDTPTRIAAFVAQVGHESGRLLFVKELWGPTPAQRRYEGRADLGNTEPGDGYRYRGRGLIQTTGRANYAGTRDGLRAAELDAPDFEVHPELLEAPKWAAYSAGWFWASRDLNDLADAGDFERLTRRINGGLNGIEERKALHAAARAALQVA